MLKSFILRSPLLYVFKQLVSNYLPMQSEFEFISSIKNRFGLSKVGDDCAVLPKDKNSDLLVTTDLLIEDIDFRLDWTTPELLGEKFLAVSLSDIAAMGASPNWAMTAVGAPAVVWNSDFIGRFYEGFGAAANGYSVELVGGDISRSPDRLVLNCIVAGECPKGKAVLRSNARPRDAIYVTGSLGGAAGGLMLLESGVRIQTASESERSLLMRQMCPAPRLELGKLLLESGVVTAMIDLSDGLSSDLHQICSASGVGAEIERSRLSIDEALKCLSLSPAAELELALNGGEDFELLFTADPAHDLEQTHPSIRRIGTVTASAGHVFLVNNEERTALTPAGFRHF